MYLIKRPILSLTLFTCTFLLGGYTAIRLMKHCDDACVPCEGENDAAEKNDEEIDMQEVYDMEEQFHET